MRSRPAHCADRLDLPVAQAALSLRDDVASEASLPFGAELGERGDRLVPVVGGVVVARAAGRWAAALGRWAGSVAVMHGRAAVTVPTPTS